MDRKVNGRFLWKIGDIQFLDEKPPVKKPMTKKPEQQQLFSRPKPKPPTKRP